MAVCTGLNWLFIEFTDWPFGCSVEVFGTLKGSELVEDPIGDQVSQ